MTERSDRRTFLKRTTFVGLGLFTTPLLRADELPTPPQTEGPFFPVKPQADRDLDLTRVEGRSGQAKGDIVVVRLQVLDRAGEPVGGAVVDLWQACASGRYANPRDPNPAPLDPDFQGWAHAATDARGEIRLRTIIPGAYPASRGWMRPPHIHFRVDAWDNKTRLTTQMYFKGQELNEADLILRDTLRSFGWAAHDSLIVDFDRERTEDGKPLGTFRIVLGQTPEAH